MGSQFPHAATAELQKLKRLQKIAKPNSLRSDLYLIDEIVTAFMGISSREKRAAIVELASAIADESE